MKFENPSCPTRSFGVLAICWSLTQLMTVTAAPQNYFEQAATGALGVAMKFDEVLQNGAAARNEIGFQLPAGIGMRSKTEIGMGEAMIQRRYSSEEDSNEYGRRRKRSLTSGEVPADVTAAGPRTSFTKLMRNINAPCHSGGGTGGGGTGGGADGGDGAEDIVDEARRRMKARRAAAGKKSTTGKSKKRSGRRRRQTEAADLEGLGDSEEAALGEEFRAHMQQFAEKMNRVYEHIAASVMEAMKRMEDNFYAEDEKS